MASVFGGALPPARILTVLVFFFKITHTTPHPPHSSSATIMQPTLNVDWLEGAYPCALLVHEACARYPPLMVTSVLCAMRPADVELPSKGIDDHSRMVCGGGEEEATTIQRRMIADPTFRDSGLHPTVCQHWILMLYANIVPLITAAPTLLHTILAGSKSLPETWSASQRVFYRIAAPWIEALTDRRAITAREMQALRAIIYRDATLVHILQSGIKKHHHRREAVETNARNWMTLYYWRCLNTEFVRWQKVPEKALKPLETDPASWMRQTARISGNNQVKPPGLASGGRAEDRANWWCHLAQNALQSAELAHNRHLVAQWRDLALLVAEHDVAGTHPDPDRTKVCSALLRRFSLMVRWCIVCARR